MRHGAALAGLIASAALLAACGDVDLRAAEAPSASAPGSMEGASCALVPADIEFGGWEHKSKTYDCLRALAYGDWSRARSEAAHIKRWDIGGYDLDVLIDTLSKYDSAEAVGEAMRAYGLLNGEGDPEHLEYLGDDWEPLTGSDWLLRAGNQYWFDAETGMYPNDHDALLHELAELFGEPLAGAAFVEKAPHWESDAPYQLRATLGDRIWTREAQNYGDWYDVATVLELINTMAADVGTEYRAMPLATFDQTVTVIVGPGESLLAAAGDGLILPAEAESAMARGRAFEEKMRRQYRIADE